MGPGDVVASALPSGGDWLVLAVALDRVGAVLAGVSTAITAAERHDQVELVRPVLVVAGPDTVDGMPLRTDVVVLAAGGRGRELAVPGAAHRRPVTVAGTTSGRRRSASRRAPPDAPKAALFRVRHLRAIQRIDLGPRRSRSGVAARRCWPPPSSPTSG